ncbi:MAG TPA: family 16 glycosylhydrolase [Candidatus Krumholzibacteria bacterium]|nr:family 16 glycosylhydrolase [Candidatus Krumholzibacteria bacterium]
MRCIRPLLFALLLGLPALAFAQVGDLLWNEDFADLDDWLVITGNGSWGWGNGELEYYAQDNVAIAPVAGEPGNMALSIIARQQSGAGIVDQWGNPLNYTSGKVITKSKISVRYGMIETRVKVPSLNLGGWPAVWLLGTSNHPWPYCGELDMMEMGAMKAFRDLHDTHNGGNGLDNATVDQMVGANAIFYTEAAITPENPSGAASLSWDPDDDLVRPRYSYDPPLTGRFVTYRMYWDDASLRFTIVDDGVEYDLYETPYAIVAESAEFRDPFYLVANLAIGGTYTDAYNLGDPGTGLPVTMPLPAEMQVDYIRVYQWNGQGEVHVGPPTFQHGVFGLYTDETPTNAGLTPGLDAQVYVWEGTLTAGTIPPYEGANVLSWQTAGRGWFGAGIMADQPVNLFDFGEDHTDVPEGVLSFRIRIPAYVTFKIGIIDAWGNQQYVTFPAYQTTYGLVRDGQWGQAQIPVSAIRGTLIDLRMLSYPFVILEESGAACEFALDDIYWDAFTTGASAAPLPAAAARTVQAAPNPFNARTEIRFELSVAGAYTVDVIDTAGRLVARFTGEGQVGPNAVAWDGRDARGGYAASGVYLCRVKGPDGTAAGSMVLVK